MAAKKLTPHRQVKVIDMYLAGETTAAIAEVLGVNAATARAYMNGLVKALNNAYATRSAVRNKWNPSGADLRFSNTELINVEFTSLLSDPEDPDAQLTMQEMMFCELYAATGDWDFACSKSGLDAGLFTEKQITGTKGGGKQKVLAETYHASVKIRAAYLRKKPNIQQYLKALDATGDIDPTKVNKEFLQKVILTEIDRLGSSPSGDMRKLSRDYVQMLGRTFGGFTEKIEIGVIDHKKSLMKLKEASSQGDDLAALRAKKEAEKKAVNDGMDS